MHPRSGIALTLCAAALAGCSGGINPFGGDDLPTLPVGPGFSISTLEWEGTEAVTRFAYAVRDNSGQTEVCGAIATEGSETIAAAETSILNNTVLNAGSTVVAPGLAFFARTDTVDQGVETNCIITETPWSDDFTTTPPEVQVNLEVLET